MKDTPEAPALAQSNLKAMGPMSKGELITLATISGAVVLWMFGDAIGCPAVLAAMLALATLLCTGGWGHRNLCVGRGLGRGWHTVDNPLRVLLLRRAASSALLCTHAWIKQMGGEPGDTCFEFVRWKPH